MVGLKPLGIAGIVIPLDLKFARAYDPDMSELNEDDFDVTCGEEIVSDSRCFVCGLANRHGLKVRFFRQGENAALATCDPPETFMGYHGFLHGGVSAALLDEVMIKAVLASGRLVVTGRMSIQYRQPVPLGLKLQLRGSISSHKGRLFHTNGVLFTDPSVPLVTATGTYMEVTGARRESLIEGLRRQQG